MTLPPEPTQEAHLSHNNLTLANFLASQDWPTVTPLGPSPPADPVLDGTAKVVALRDEYSL